MKDLVAIVGYMGCGKSTVGRLLAGRLGAAFVDLDEAVARRAGRSIPLIFAERGEEGFRELEHGELAAALGGGEARVVACGGGAVLREDNRRLLGERAATVFLEEDLRRLYARTRAADRPLRGASFEEFRRRYELRLPLYREVADLTVEVDGRGVEEVAEEIARWLRG
ncbi:Shikimate kinase 1 [Rubrobacter xylanophilus DSM 9941]|nr:Shikimate kinase 1 [Rubrobacter xylanophilus DSM 9941]